MNAVQYRNPPANGGIYGNTCKNEAGDIVASDNFFFNNYSQSTGVVREVERTDSTFAVGNVGSYIVKKTSTLFDEVKYQPIRITTNRSDNDQKQVTVNTYPYQFLSIGTVAGNALGIGLLNQKNIIASPIEKYTYIQNSNGTNARMISGQVTTFRQNVSNSTQVVPDQIYLWESAAASSFSSYIPLSIKSNGSELTLDPNYKPRINFTSYDSYGNLKQYSKVNDVTTAYTYGYRNALPIAEVKNAQNTEFFIENFEENNSSGVIQNANLAHSGKSYYSGAYTANFTLPNGRSYVIDYFYLDNSNVWQHVVKSYTGSSVRLMDGSAFDDVRIYPKDAQVNSYTYDPLLGITSIIDPAGLLHLYDYDSFGRLKRIRDYKGTIEKQYLYNYKGN